MSVFEEKQYFFVSQREDFGPVYGNTDFIMDTVQTIVGSGYSQSTGRFTAPAKASYQFNVTISAQKTKQVKINDKISENASISLTERLGSSALCIIGLSLTQVRFNH